MGNTTKVEPKKVKESEFKTYVDLIIIKIGQQKQKKIKEIQNKRRDIANLLQSNQLDIAKLKMENIITCEKLIVAYDILSTVYEVLKEKVTSLLHNDACPKDLRATLDTVIYCADEIDIKEMQKIKEAVHIKYGSFFVSNAKSNIDGLVNQNIIKNINVENTPNNTLIYRIKQIVIEDKIDYTFPQEYDVGTGLENEKGSGNQLGELDGSQNFFPNPQNLGQFNDPNFPNNNLTGVNTGNYGYSNMINQSNNYNNLNNMNNFNNMNNMNMNYMNNNSNLNYNNNNNMMYNNNMMNNFGNTGIGTFNNGTNPYQQNMLNSQLNMNQSQFGQIQNSQITPNVQNFQGIQGNQFNNFKPSIIPNDNKQNLNNSNINYVQGSSLSQPFQSTTNFNDYDNYSKNFNNISNQFQSIQNPNLNQFGNMPNPENYSQNFTKPDFQVQSNLQNQSEINNNYSQYQNQFNNNNIQNPQVMQSINYNTLPDTGFDSKENKLNLIPSQSIIVNNQNLNNISPSINQFDNNFNVINPSINNNNFQQPNKFNLDNLQVIPPNNESIRQELIKNSKMLDNLEMSKSVIIQDNNENQFNQSQPISQNQFYQSQQFSQNQFQTNTKNQQLNFGIGGGVGMNFYHSSSNLDPSNPYSGLGNSMNFFKNPQDNEGQKGNNDGKDNQQGDDLGFP